jgi:hypothetical protein
MFGCEFKGAAGGVDAGDLLGSQSLSIANHFDTNFKGGIGGQVGGVKGQIFSAHLLFEFLDIQPFRICIKGREFRLRVIFNRDHTSDNFFKVIDVDQGVMEDRKLQLQRIIVINRVECE